MYEDSESIRFQLDSSHQLISWNRRFETITGYPDASSGQLYLSDIVEPGDLSKVEAAIRNIHRTRRSTIHCRLTHRDEPTSVPYRLLLTSLKSPSEPLVGIRGVEWQSGPSNPVLSWNEETLRRIFNHSHDGIFVYDSNEDLIVEANPRACLMFGYGREELIAMSITDIIPDGLQPVGGSVGELVCEMKSGRRFPAQISVSEINLGDRNCLLVILCDIRERKRVEQAEKKLERLASFPELNRHPIIELTSNGVITYYNPAAVKHFPILNHVEDVHNGDPSSPLIRCLCEALDSLQSKTIDRLVRELTVDTSVYEVHISRIRPQKVIRIYLHDVTDRKLAEAEVAELKSFYQEVLGDLPMELAVFDREGRYMYLNRAAVSDDQMREWLIGRTSVDYARFRGLEPELFEERHRWLQETIERKETREREEVMVDEDGTTRHKLRIVSPVTNGDGYVKYALGYGLDVTERRKAMEALRAEKEFTEEIINSLDDAFFAFDREGHMVRWNNHVIRLTGYTDEEIAAMSPMDFVPEEEIINVYRQIITGFSTGEVAFETRLRTKSGDVLPFEVIGSYLEWNNRTILAGIGRDISEHKQHERKLIDAKESAEEMSRLKSAFLANMSHEIRTPLTAILGFADVLEEEMVPVQREFIHLIQQSGKRLLHTLDSVLDLAQLEAGSKTIDPQPVDLVHHIREPVEMFKPQARQKGIDLFLDTPDQPVIATVDPAGLVRIITNLLSNGIKFTDTGDVVVRVRPNGQYVDIDVEDTGRGIDPAFQAHLFDAFKQESTGLDRSHEGTGLGLTIAKQLTELMNGTITVESAKGEGSTFTVRLPR